MADGENTNFQKGGINPGWTTPQQGDLEDIQSQSNGSFTATDPIIPGEIKSLVSGVPVPLLSIDVSQTVEPPPSTPDHSFGCKLFFIVECTDGTDAQLREGDCNAGVSYNVVTTTFATAQAVNASNAITGGTLTVAFTWSFAGTVATLSVTATTSLVPTNFKIRYLILFASHPFKFL